MRSDVGNAMADLALHDRQMLWLAYVEGASHREIARVLGLKAASIRSMLSRARKRLAEQLTARGLRPNVEAP
jgi:RNA polymerase sigma-70 factor (ECF subfamily)